MTEIENTIENEEKLENEEELELELDEEFDGDEELDEDDEELSDDEVFATPLAKRMAENADLDLSTVEGTGTNGRIVKSDVEKAIEDSGRDDDEKGGALVLNNGNGASVVSSSNGSGAVYKDVPHSDAKKRNAENSQTQQALNI
jgi:pyruvate/2-oxoglutarate dehydrogenase complex dihydrolipoamide acyltransferase (E2) component